MKPESILPPPREPPLTEPTPAPEILVDGYAHSFVVGGNGKLTFFAIGLDPATGQLERRIVLRLSAAVPVIAATHEALGRFLAQIVEAETAAQEANDG